MGKYGFARVNFAQPEVAAGLDRAYRILLERALRRQQPIWGETQCLDVEECVEEKTTDGHEREVSNSGKTEEVGIPALMQEG
jgi:hypothetical protein